MHLPTATTVEDLIVDLLHSDVRAEAPTDLSHIELEAVVCGHHWRLCTALILHDRERVDEGEDAR
jgi:hypothetical protein